MICISPQRVNVKGNYHDVPCGKCGSCLSNKRNDWSFRLWEELRSSASGWFVTLTYNDDHIKPFLDKRHVQSFIDSLRYYDGKVRGKVHSIGEKPGEGKYRPPVRYYAVGEYGPTTYRPHYHLLVYNIHNETMEQIPEIWGKGNVKIKPMAPWNIHYTTKYLITHPSQDTLKKELCKIQPEFTLMSRRPGIGYGYLKRAEIYHAENLDFRVKMNGINLNMPRYYRDKIFSEDEKNEHRHTIETSMAEKFWDNKRKSERIGDNYFIVEDQKKRATEKILNKAIKNSKL